MSTVKISQLDQIYTLNSNTSNVFFVGIDSNSEITGKYTARTIADGLYKNNILLVGNNDDNYPNTVAQFSGTSTEYIQMSIENILNTQGTADLAIGAGDVGTDTEYYIDLGFANSEYDNLLPYNSLGTSLNPLDGYMYVQGNTAGTPGGNLVIGTTTTGKTTKFISGGINSENVVAEITQTGLKIETNKTITFGDGTVQSTAAASNAYSQAAFSLANVNSQNITYAYGVNETQNTNLATANTWLQANDASTLSTAKSYTDTANTWIRSNYLANTTGTFNGALTFTGTVSTTSQFNANNSTFSSTSSLVRFNASGNQGQLPDQDGYTIHSIGKSGVPNRIMGDSYGTGAYVLFGGRAARGTPSTPTAVQSGDVLIRLAGNGWGTTGYAPLGVGRIEIAATENFTDTNRGCAIKFSTTTNGSNVVTEIASFTGNTATFTGVISPQKGFIYTPNVVNGSTTTLTLDISNTSLLKCNSSGGLIITPTNFATGKVCEVWFINSSGSTQSVTHGVSANNSTVGSTSFNIAGNKVAYLRYFSIDDDLANTFVSVAYQ